MAHEQTLPSRDSAVRRAIGLEWITIAWMLIEGAVAIWSGVIAHSVSVTAFGIDSIIELMSAGVLMWRLQTEVRHGVEFAKNTEHRAHQIAGALLLLLAAYVVVSAGLSLIHRQGQEFTWAGLAVTAAAALIMNPLARAKLKVADELSSRALRADAAESLTCGYLSIIVLVGLIAQYFLNAWWIDAAASLFIVWYLVREGLEGVRTEGDCCP